MQRRNSILIFYALLFPFGGFAQDITGLWKGTLYNDTTKKYLPYEIAISENKGKLSGYTHTFFILDDKEYYGVKKVKVRKAEGKIIIQDEELIANNYPILPSKGVHMIDILTLEVQDSIMLLTGPFSTNRTKEFRPLTGNIRLQRKNDCWQSALVPHLEELGLANDLSFVQVERLLGTKTAVTVAPLVAKVTTGKKEKPVLKPQPVITTSPTVISSAPVVILPAADVNKRIIETIQSVYFKSDSLVLTLYDNGEVDGDTVSVLMNGKVIMPMQGLSTKAIRKTIYITKDMPDSIQLIMYAENLGSIPPNTGLLVVHDGEDVYEIRFSGDLQKNAAIVFRRKNH